MKTLFAISVIVFSLVGCATKEQLIAQNAARQKIIDDTYIAKKNSIIECEGKGACDKYFKLAKIFIHEHSDMKVQTSDDVSIITYNPFRYGDCGMSVYRKPITDTKEKISLDVYCKTSQEYSEQPVQYYRLFSSEVAQKK